MTILATIVHHKKQEVAVAKRHHPISGFDSVDKVPIRDFIKALSTPKTSIIAEIKKASPSKGLIRKDFDVAKIATIYETHGAACLSVLTDRHFFQGDLSYLQVAKKVTTIPILRKDFIIDPYQIDESHALAADCILLIVAILDDYQLHDYCQQAMSLNMAVLVESHTEEELQRALKLPTPLMGINNRDLHSFVTDMNLSRRLAEHLPPDKMLISESGINTRQDILRLQEHGIKRFLIGESLMREKDIGSKLKRLLT